MTTEAQQATPETPATTPAPAPVPGTPEHRTAMIAAYDAQFVQAGTAPVETAVPPQPATQAQTAPQQPLPNDQVPPKLTPTPPKEGEAAPAEGEKKQETPAESKTLGDLYTSGELLSGFNAEEVPPTVASAFKAAGLDDAAIAEMHERFRAGQLALQREHVANLQKAAGGAEAFNALVAWGQQNLTPEQCAFYDQQLEGPNAADVIALLRQRMSAGRDPQLVVPNGQTSPAVSGFRDKAEMIEAMSHPNYQKSDAYRAEVQRKLAASKF